MFFKHRFYRSSEGQSLTFTPHTALDLGPLSGYAHLHETFAHEIASPCADRTAIISIDFALGLPEEIAAELCDVRPDGGNAEEYAVLLGRESHVWAATEQGLLYGFMTVLQMIDHEELSPALLYDYPVSPVRGYRVYLPGRAQMADFRRMLDFIAYYKFNAIILEIGGAMEYHRHPEVNAAWSEFCTDMHRYSGRSMEVQRGYPWEKNSIHCDNGGGDVLTQDECRALADYCRARGLEVIPECPTLSHSDYLVMAHPELREREEDPYPDTYCPMHPDTYPLVFDILDEVIDVFRPARINIGHDELYTVGLCPRCREHDPVELYVGDVRRLRDYLAERGIGVLMWGEKLLRAVDEKGRKFGGWTDEKVRHGVRYRWPNLYPCADKMPDGVTYLHWYWRFDEKLDRVYHDRSYPVIFANFSALLCKNFAARLAAGMQGGFASNWGANEDEYMQRNQQYFDLLGCAYAFWCPDFDTDDRLPAFINRVFREGYRRRLKETPHPITITHTTDGHIPYKWFYDGIFIEDELYLLGQYELSYDDGSTASLPVKYGTNITNSLIDDVCTNQLYHEMCGGTLPTPIGDRMYYTAVYENPQPEKTVVGIRYRPLPGKEDFRVYLRTVDFGDAGTLSGTAHTDEKASIIG